MPQSRSFHAPTLSVRDHLHTPRHPAPWRAFRFRRVRPAPARTSALRPRPRRHGARPPTSRRSSGARPARLQQAAPATLLVMVPSPCGPSSSSLRLAQRALDSDDPEDARGWRTGGRGRRRDLTTGGSCAKPRRGGPLARGACHRSPSPRSPLPRWPSLSRGSSAGDAHLPWAGAGARERARLTCSLPPRATRRSSASRGRVVTGGGRRRGRRGTRTVGGRGRTRGWTIAVDGSRPMTPRQTSSQPETSRSSSSPGRRRPDDAWASSRRWPHRRRPDRQRPGRPRWSGVRPPTCRPRNGRAGSALPTTPRSRSVRQRPGLVKAGRAAGRTSPGLVCSALSKPMFIRAR